MKRIFRAKKTNWKDLYETERATHADTIKRIDEMRWQTNALECRYDDLCVAYVKLLQDHDVLHT